VTAATAPQAATSATLVRRAKDAIATGNASSWEAADCFLELSRLGWTQARIARECESTQSTVSKFIACAKRYSLANTRPRFWDAYQAVDGKRAAHVGQASGWPEWFTPAEYLDAARNVLGTIDLDPASCAKAQETVQASTYLTAEQDGLERPWQGRVWLNPPYGQVDRFAAKLCEAHRSGAVPEALLLTNNATETAWFQQTARMASALCLPAGRIQFADQTGTVQKQPLQGQAILYFGPDVQRFIERFTVFGLCFSIQRPST